MNKDCEVLINTFKNLESFYWRHCEEDEDELNFYCRLVNAKENTPQEFNNGLKDLRSLLLINKRNLTEKEFNLINDKMNILQKYVGLLFDGVNLDVSIDMLTESTINNYTKRRRFNKDYFKCRFGIEDIITLRSDEDEYNTDIFVLVNNGKILKETNTLDWDKRSKLFVENFDDLNRYISMKGKSKRAKAMLKVLKNIVLDKSKKDCIETLYNCEIDFTMLDTSKEYTYTEKVIGNCLSFKIKEV